MSEIFSKYPQHFNTRALQEILTQRQKWWDYKNNVPFKELLHSLPDFKDCEFFFTQEHLQIKGDFPSQEENIKKLIPWKKGPFKLNDYVIDSEWNSDLKWQRIKKAIPSLEDQNILDVGCNNGYYMFRMLEQNPALVLGIDPVAIYKAQFDYINHFVRAPQLSVELLGAEHIQYIRDFFDGIFYMGILYHHRDPISHLISIREALKPGGWALIETIGIPGEDSYSLTPKERYANMPNIWFVPTLNCLIDWLEKCKFTDIEIISTDWNKEAEQRVSKDGPSQSYEHFLNPENNQQTIEGYPAPERFALLVRRKK